MRAVRNEHGGRARAFQLGIVSDSQGPVYVLIQKISPGRDEYFSTPAHPDIVQRRLNRGRIDDHSVSDRTKPFNIYFRLKTSLPTTARWIGGGNDGDAAIVVFGGVGVPVELSAAAVACRVVSAHRHIGVAADGGERAEIRQRANSDVIVGR